MNELIINSFFLAIDNKDYIAIETFVKYKLIDINIKDKNNLPLIYYVMNDVVLNEIFLNHDKDNYRFKLLNMSDVIKTLIRLNFIE